MWIWRQKGIKWKEILDNDVTQTGTLFCCILLDGFIVVVVVEFIKMKIAKKKMKFELSGNLWDFFLEIDRQFNTQEKYRWRL